MKKVTETEGKKAQKERKTGSIMLRLSDREREILERKRDEAGAKSSAEFIRDYVINAQPKQRKLVIPDVLLLQNEFDYLAQTIMGPLPECKVKDDIRRHLSVIQEKILPSIRQYEINQADDEMEALEYQGEDA
jgi:hypothetical protein